MTQGARANQSGKSAEHVIGAMLDRCNVAYVRQHSIGLGIYQTPIKVDFFIRARQHYPDGLVIESKWQDVSGSADEKLPYLVANIRECFPSPAVIVIDGDGFRSGAILWLRRQIDSHLVAVYTIAQFVTWANRTLRASS